VNRHRMERRRRLRGLLALTVLLGGVVVALAVQPVLGERGATRLRVLWTNDTHGYLKPLYHREPWDADYERLARQEGKLGGFAHIATLVKRLRGEMPDRTLLLDSGDTWHGTAVPLFEGGKTVVRVMNAMKYDAMTPGNVEFLYPREVLLARIKEARFPVIAANWVDDVEDPVVPPYVVKTVGGLRVGIIGMTYQWSRKTGDPKLTEGWSFGFREHTVREYIRELREDKKVDLVLMISHMGFGADVKFASRVSGIDAILGAHTHDYIDPVMKVNGTLVCQAGSHGKNLGRLDLWVKDGKIVRYDHQIYRIRVKEIPPDPAIQKIIDEGYAPYRAKLERVIGQTKTMLFRRATWQSTMDNFITDAYRDMEGADVAFGPAWRFGATILPGDIRVEDVYNMVPAAGHLLTYTLTGQAIKDLLESALDNVLNEDPYLVLGGDMTRFSGLEVRFDPRRPLGQRFVSIKVNGKPLDPKRRYRIVSANTQFHRMRGVEQLRDTGKVAVEELIKYIERKKVIAPKLDDRIKAVPGREKDLKEIEDRRVFGPGTGDRTKLLRR